jgi:hypothetical protein
MMKKRFQGIHIRSSWNASFAQYLLSHRQLSEEKVKVPAMPILVSDKEILISQLLSKTSARGPFDGVNGTGTFWTDVSVGYR